jgi:hypothetical protein
VLVGLLLVAIEEVVVGNKVVDVVIVLAAVGDVIDVELVWVDVVAALVEAVKETTICNRRFRNYHIWVLNEFNLGTVTSHLRIWAWPFYFCLQIIYI